RLAGVPHGGPDGGRRPRRGTRRTVARPARRRRLPVAVPQRPLRGTGGVRLSSEGQDLLFRHARTANTFADEPVTDDQIRAIYDLVKYGPTAVNGQPLRIVLMRSVGARARLLPYLAEANRAKTATAPLVAILA